MAATSLFETLNRYRDRVPLVGPLLLYWLPLPLLPAVFIALARGNFVNFATALGALVALLASAWAIRRGMKRDVELARLGWSRTPPAPWKLLGATGCGLATAACSFFIIRHSLPAAIAVGLTALVAVLLNYGLDRVFSRRVGDRLLASRDREVAEALQEARRKIESIDAARRQIDNPELKRRIERIARQAMDILTVIADDPTTLRRARRFLKVYLDGTRRVTEGYASIHRDGQQGVLEENFRNVLITIEDTFAEQQRKLQEKDLMDLDVQIEVLTHQLKNEGVI